MRINMNFWINNIKKKFKNKILSKYKKMKNFK